MNMFAGRLDRTDYLIGMIMVAAAYFALVFPIISVFEIQSGELFQNPAFIAVYGITFIFMSALAVRRLHDIGLSGWWFLLYFVPFLNFGFVLYLFLKRGSTGVNIYGGQLSHRVRIGKILFG